MTADDKAETTQPTVPTLPVGPGRPDDDLPAARHCPDCAAEATLDEAYCEECGAVLPPTRVLPAPPPAAGPDLADPRDLFDQPPGDEPAAAAARARAGRQRSVPAAVRCPGCGSDLGTDGFCQACGRRVAPARPGDHDEVDLGRLAGVRDRGLVHHENEDAMGLALVPAPGPGAGDRQDALVAVVCDGVSTAPGSGPAAAAAAAAAARVLSDWLAGPPPDADDTTLGGQDRPARAADLTGALRAAARAASRAMPGPRDGAGAPSCTFAAAVLAGGWLTVGWLGDSRVYLLGAGGGAVRLTADDTMAAEAVRAGLLPAAAAESARGAHTITRWLAADSAEPEPRVTALPVTEPGRVVVCTDGLWNYASGAAELAARVADLPERAVPLAVARHLVSVALRAGGRDNVTVVVMDIPGSA
jgi:serine/threonine protein phosphatase PrpC